MIPWVERLFITWDLYEGVQTQTFSDAIMITSTEAG